MAFFSSPQLNIFILFNVMCVLFTHISGNETSDIKQIRYSNMLYKLTLIDTAWLGRLKTIIVYHVESTTLVLLDVQYCQHAEMSR